MPILYRLADTLVFPSLKEGFGLCVLEAMASGVPVVVSSIRPLLNIWVRRTRSGVPGLAIQYRRRHADVAREALARSAHPARIRGRGPPRLRTAAHLHIAAYSRLQEAANA